VPRTALAALLGISAKHLDLLRKQFGNAAEEVRGPHRQVFLYAPDWIKAYIEHKSGPKKGRTGKRTAEQQKKRYDALTAKARYRELIRELIPADEVEAVFREIANELSSALTVAERISPDACERLVVALASAEQKLKSRLHGRNGHTNGHTKAAKSRA
jgi:hypothetical protein